MREFTLNGENIDYKACMQFISNIFCFDVLIYKNNHEWMTVSVF